MELNMTEQMPERLVAPTLGKKRAEAYYYLELHNLPDKMMDKQMMEKYKDEIAWKRTFNDWAKTYIDTFKKNFSKHGKHTARKKAMDEIRKLEISN